MQLAAGKVASVYHALIEAVAVHVDMRNFAVDFRGYGDLAQRYVEGVDYAVELTTRERSSVAVLAPHGGRIEGRTSEIARVIAGAEHHLYVFEGLRTTGDNFDCLHLASHRFDEPRALDLIAGCDIVVAVHGYAAPGPDVLLGGLDEALKQRVAQALLRIGISCESEGHRFPGKDPRNICNRGRTGAGVQMEFSEAFRRAGEWSAVSAAVRSAIAGHDAAIQA